jgi:uridine phosphorylase
MKDSSFKPQQPLPSSELVLDNRGAVYHLGLLPHEIADTILVVGDQNRVAQISQHFDTIEHKVAHREFVTHTGSFDGHRISALSTGIGVDNIDIVLNELDALANIDLTTRSIRDEKKVLKIIRIGTSGALNAEISVGSFVHSKYAIGLDGMLNYYDLSYEDDETDLLQSFLNFVGWTNKGITPYAVRGSNLFDAALADFSIQGITVTANGFYGPQGRKLRLNTRQDLNDKMSAFSFNNLPIMNYEMESSALFGLGAALGHECTTICTVIANRMRKEFLKDSKSSIDSLILKVLHSITAH